MPALTDLPWNCIDSIIEFLRSPLDVARLMPLHSALHDRAAEDYVWEALTRLHLPLVYGRLRARRALVYSWRAVMRRETSRRHLDVVSALHNDAITATEKARLRGLHDISLRGGMALGSSGGERIGSIILAGGNRRLETLDVGGQTLRAEGATALAQYLPECPRLQMLLADENRLGSSAAALALTLAVPTLRHLNLARNGLSEKDVQEIASALPVTIATLVLDGNDVGSQGFAAVCGALCRPQHTSLRLLSVRGGAVRGGEASVRSAAEKLVVHVSTRHVAAQAKATRPLTLPRVDVCNGAGNDVMLWSTSQTTLGATADGAADPEPFAAAGGKQASKRQNAWPAAEVPALRTLAASHPGVMLLLPAPSEEKGCLCS